MPCAYAGAPPHALWCAENLCRSAYSTARLPVVEDRLLRSLQLREVLARQLHHHGAIDLLRARMPFDDLRESVHDYERRRSDGDGDGDV